jgi:hypothetical protein
MSPPVAYVHRKAESTSLIDPYFFTHTYEMKMIAFIESDFSIAYFISKCISLTTELRELMFKSVARGSTAGIEVQFTKD